MTSLALYVAELEGQPDKRAGAALKADGPSGWGASPRSSVPPLRPDRRDAPSVQGGIRLSRAGRLPGPVAHLEERFRDMEEVAGAIPVRPIAFICDGGARLGSRSWRPRPSFGSATLAPWCNSEHAGLSSRRMPVQIRSGSTSAGCDSLGPASKRGRKGCYP